MSDSIGLKIHFNRRSFEGDAKNMNTAGQAGAVTAVVNRIGEASMDADFLGQLKLQVVLVAEGSSAIWIKRNRY